MKILLQSKNKIDINKLSLYSKDSFLREQILKAIQKGFESVKFFNNLKK